VNWCENGNFEVLTPAFPLKAYARTFFFERKSQVAPAPQRVVMRLFAIAQA
jgi:hypothetical protein